MNLRFLSQLLLYTKAGVFLTLPALASIQIEASIPTPETVVSIQVTETTQNPQRPLSLTDFRSDFDQNINSNQDVQSDQSINQDANQDFDFNRDRNNDFDA